MMIPQDSSNATPFPNLQQHSSERLPPGGFREQIRSDFSKNVYRVIKVLSDTNRFGLRTFAHKLIIFFKAFLYFKDLDLSASVKCYRQTMLRNLLSLKSAEVEN